MGNILIFEREITLTPSEMLLGQAKSYIILARNLSKDNIDARHYIKAAKDSIAKYKALQNNEVTKTINIKLLG